MKLNPTIKFIPSKVHLNEDQLSAFETQIGYKLPPDYRTFLMLYNNAKMEPEDTRIDTLDFALSIDLRNFDDLTSGGSRMNFLDVSSWIGFADPKADYQYGLVEQYEVTSKDWSLPKSIIPIARSRGPAMVYMNLSADSGFGNILLVGDTLYERQGDGMEIRVKDFVCIASSFNEFVANLKWVDVTSY